jgi:hypothetical protein
MEKTTRYYIWRDIICDILTAIEAMEENANRVAAEHREPTFLIDLTDYGGDTRSKSSADTKSKGNSKGKQSKMQSRFGGIKSGLMPREASRAPTSVMRKQDKGKNIQDRKSMQSSPSPNVPAKNGKIKKNDSSSGDSLPLDTPTEGVFMKWSAFEERLRAAFIKCGEAPTQSALMNLIFPFDFHQTEVYAKLQGKFRINELTDLIRRILNVLTETTPTVIMVYESQWMDPLSWELLWELSISCPRIMVCLFSRPEKYHENEETRIQYQKFKRHLNTQVLSLEGLSTDETAKLIMANWTTGITTKENTIQTVQQVIVDNVQKKTGGNPLYIKSMVVALKESGQCRIDAQHQLRLVSDNLDFDKSVGIGGNLQSVLVAQFDRLDTNFQLFLKVSSVLGQPFLLEDVLYLLSDTPGFSEMFDVSFMVG